MGRSIAKTDRLIARSLDRSIGRPTANVYNYIYAIYIFTDIDK